MGYNFEAIISGEMLGTPTQCYTFVLYDDTGQKTRLNSFHSVWQQQESFQKLDPSKILIDSWTDLNVDSGSCYSSKCKLRPESTLALRRRDHLWHLVKTPQQWQHWV